MKTLAQRLAPDVTLETRLYGHEVVHVAVVDVAEHSSRAVAVAIARAHEVLRDVPEVVTQVEVRVDDASRDALQAAKDKRALRANKNLAREGERLALLRGQN